MGKGNCFLIQQKYMELQTKYIRERIERFDNKLYLEFGGKLFDDFHAARYCRVLTLMPRSSC